MPTHYFTFVHGVFVQSPFVSLLFTSRSTDYDMCRVIELRETKRITVLVVRYVFAMQEPLGTYTPDCFRRRKPSA
ncbi:hypothetical protein EYC80_005031 [Monilinia laxa]|uniref:Uncharacterized protein n=1 Tax=Monilinia laxa TaxID=61186 RepID=A0A5N6KIX5_MONLA|nr:hypothetical protein EYC80_005031 [Monilinia laxa]